jgi:hypothetical protein
MKTMKRRYRSFGPCDVHVGFPKFDRWPTLTLLATVASCCLRECMGQQYKFLFSRSALISVWNFIYFGSIFLWIFCSLNRWRGTCNSWQSLWKKYIIFQDLIKERWTASKWIKTKCLHQETMKLIAHQHLVLR